MTKKEKEEERAGKARAKKFIAEHAKMDKPDIVQQLRHVSVLEDQVFKYFHYRSKLWREIQEHLVRAADCVLIDRPRRIAIHSSGYGVHFQKAWLWAMNYEKNPPEEGKNYALEFRVEYVIEDDDDEPPEEFKTYQIAVPIALELDFTKKGFEEWITEVRAKRDAERSKKDLYELDRLVKKYPDKAREHLAK